MTTNLAHHLNSLPTQPGVYQFKNSQGDILYVGKAKILRNRVRSYFRNHAALDPAKQQMIPKIASLETIVTDTENEALILEANLIRQHRPPYNVVLTDDKYYLFIKITMYEEFPRVFTVRRIDHDGDRRRQGSGLRRAQSSRGQARYFGPYSSARAVRHTLKLLRRIFPYRAEKDSPNDIIFPHSLFTTFVKNNGLNNLTIEQYKNNIQNIIRFLQGDRQKIIDVLRTGMHESSQNKQFERATIFRDQLQALERLEGYQKVFLPRPESFDVISIVTEGSRSAANVLAVRKGKLLDKNTFLLKHHSATNNEDILRQFLLQYYRVAQDVPPTILIPTLLADIETIAQWINKENPPLFATPHRGKKRQLIIMGQLNAQQLLSTETIAFVQDARLKRALAKLFKVLSIQPAFANASAGDPPQWRIETYDISNIQGKQATGSMIVFTDGQPDKSQYRKFRITTKDTPDDYHMLQEVLRRRFSNRHPEWKQPDLLLIDGGKGQLNAAHKILEELNVKIPVASIAKREEILFTYQKTSSLPSPQAGRGEPARRLGGGEGITERQNPHPNLLPVQGEGTQKKIKEIRLPFDSDALYLIQRMRDEAHRFGVTYHRLLRNKQNQRSLLDEIPGIGPRTKKQLLNHFGSLKNIRTATDDELIKVIGAAKTKNLRNFF